MKLLQQATYIRCAFKPKSRPFMRPAIGRCPIYENYTEFYFDAKHLEMGLNEEGGAIFLCPFQKSTLLGQYWTLP